MPKSWEKIDETCERDASYTGCVPGKFQRVTADLQWKINRQQSSSFRVGSYTRSCFTVHKSTPTNQGGFVMFCWVVMRCRSMISSIVQKHKIVEARNREIGAGPGKSKKLPFAIEWYANILIQVLVRWPSWCIAKLSGIGWIDHVNFLAHYLNMDTMSHIAALSM